MIKRWSENNSSLEIQDVLDELGEPYKLHFDTDSGLPGNDFEEFFDKAEIGFNEPQNYSIDGWVNLLKNKGPLLVDVMSFFDPATNTIWTHVRLLVGIEKDENDPNSTKFIFIDPAKGREIKESFEDFLALYEAEPQNQVDNIQVAFTK